MTITRDITDTHSARDVPDERGVTRRQLAATRELFAEAIASATTAGLTVATVLTTRDSDVTPDAITAVIVELRAAGHEVEVPPAGDVIARIRLGVSGWEYREAQP